MLELGQAAKAAAGVLRGAGTRQKNEALFAIADALRRQQAQVLAANEQDLAAAEENGVRRTMLDRLRLTGQRLDAMAELILRMEDTARHRAFYHRPGSQSFHTELNLRICEYLVPHVAEELSDACARGELRLEHPELTASYLLHGQIGLLGESGTPLETRVALLRRCADRILAPEN